MVGLMPGYMSVIFKVVSVGGGREEEEIEEEEEEEEEEESSGWENCSDVSSSSRMRLRLRVFSRSHLLKCCGLLLGAMAWGLFGRAILILQCKGLAACRAAVCCCCGRLVVVVVVAAVELCECVQRRGEGVNEYVHSRTDGVMRAVESPTGRRRNGPREWGGEKEKMPSFSLPPSLHSHASSWQSKGKKG